MVQAPHRTTVRGPTFVRLLARLADAEAPPSSPSLPDRLSQWLDWTHAVALSTALDGKLPAADGDAPAFDGDAPGECARVRAALAAAIARGESAGTSRGGQAAVAHDGNGESTDYAPFRQHYLAMQRAMQAATGDLRGRLREQLARRSPAQARLAELDAAMERLLSPREQALLAGVPTVLGERFERLRQAAPPAPGAASGAWLDVFRRDLQAALLAELDVRFQPVEALLAALRPR